MAHTRDFLPEELGRSAQIKETAKAVKAAMADAGIADPADVHFVQIKCPLLTSDRVEAANARGNTTATTSAYSSMAYSRGASALGVALALGEIALRRQRRRRAAALRSVLDRRLHLVRDRADAQRRHRARQLGVFSERIRDRTCRDERCDRCPGGDVGVEQRRAWYVAPQAAEGRELVNIFAKAEASPDGSVRGFRHTMLEDTDISSTRHARAAVGGLIAGLAGTGAVYVSGGAEHQGPAGGGPVAVIARLS